MKRYEMGLASALMRRKDAYQMGIKVKPVRPVKVAKPIQAKPITKKPKKVKPDFKHPFDAGAYLRCPKEGNLLKMELERFGRAFVCSCGYKMRIGF